MSFILTHEVLGKIFERSDEMINYIKKTKHLSPEMILSDPKKLMAMNYGFLVVVQSILTLSNYIVVKKKLGVPKDYMESVQMLVMAKIIPKKFMEKLKILVDLRNIIMHKSASMTITEIKTMMENIDVLDEVYTSVKRAIEKLIGESVE